MSRLGMSKQRYEVGGHTQQPAHRLIVVLIVQPAPMRIDLHIVFYGIFGTGNCIPELRLTGRIVLRQTASMAAEIDDKMPSNHS